MFHTMCSAMPSYLIVYQKPFRILISDWTVGLEGEYRLIFTDYLDNVSTEYQDPNSFGDPNAAALADRGPRNRTNGQDGWQSTWQPLQ